MLAGESGSGKSTIAKLILRSITPDSGKIFFSRNQITILRIYKKFGKNKDELSNDSSRSI